MKVGNLKPQKPELLNNNSSLGEFIKRKVFKVLAKIKEQGTKEPVSW
jgi:hypothetical protein